MGAFTITGPGTPSGLLDAGQTGTYRMNPPLAYPCRIVAWYVNGVRVPNTASIGDRYGAYSLDGWSGDGQFRITSHVDGGSPQITIITECPPVPGYFVATRPHGDWNDSGLVQGNNNCYDYACGKKSGKVGGHESQPGLAHGKTLTRPVDCNQVKAGAVADGLSWLGKDKDLKCPSGCQRVALVCCDADYHWYREDSPGHWSHKPGLSQATDNDYSGNPVTDPEDADRRIKLPDGAVLEYSRFCGYFCVCPGAVKIAMLAPKAGQLLASARLTGTTVVHAGPIVAQLPPGRLEVSFVADKAETATVSKPTYSGMPDPSWRLSARDTAQIFKLLEAMSPQDGPPDEFSPAYAINLPKRRGAPAQVTLDAAVLIASYGAGRIGFFRTPKALLSLLGRRIAAAGRQG